MKAINEFCDINQLAEQFILQFGVESHKDLKRVGEFQSLEDEALKRKIYDRTRYKLQKERFRCINFLKTKLSQESDIYLAN